MNFPRNVLKRKESHTGLAARRQSLAWCRRGGASRISLGSHGAEAQFEAPSGVAAAIFDWSCSQRGNCPCVEQLKLSSLQPVCSACSRAGPCSPSLCLSKAEGLRVQVEQGWNVQAWLWSSPAGGSRAVTCSSQDISDTASPLCETVPADENALRCVFAWRNRESVYLLVL